MIGGEVLRGNASNQYELLARLAQGGMAEIFLARANGLAGFERYVVLKRIRPERDDDPRWVNMFLDEARLVAQLQHPNVAQVFDLGQIGDAYFYTMEYVHGEDVLDVLSRIVATGQRMPLHISLAIIAGAAQGLAYAHDRVGTDGKPLSIVHRDISPANLMISFDGVVKVLDFGVARSRMRENKTEAGTLMGKVAYLSPEQCTTNNIDHRSDLFSLGIVLYEMITHVRPFKRGSDYETLSAIVNFDPPPPSTVVKNLPAGLDAMVMRALAKDPDQRYQSAHELLEALEAVADSAQVSLAPRDLKRYMRDLYGTPPEPWRTLVDSDEQLGTFSGEVIGPLAEETRMRAFPATADAEDVPLLDGVPSAAKGTPMSRDGSSLMPGLKPSTSAGPGSGPGSGNETMDLDDLINTPGALTFAAAPLARTPRGTGSAPLARDPRMTGPPLPAAFVPDPIGTMEVISPATTGPGVMPYAYEHSGSVSGPFPSAMPAQVSLATLTPVAPRRRSWGVVVITMLAVVGAGLAMVLLLGGSPDKPAAIEPAAAPPVTRPEPAARPAESPTPPAPSVTHIEDPEAKPPGKGSANAPAKVEAKPPATNAGPPVDNGAAKPDKPKKPRKPAASKCTDPLDCQH